MRLRLRNWKLRPFVFVELLLLLILSCCSFGPTYPESAERVEEDATESPSGGGGKASASRFSLSSANHTVPSDVAEEVNFYGGGGESGCIGYEAPGLELGLVLGCGEELGTKIYSLSCGWQSDELVRVTLKRPDGKAFHWEENASLDLNQATYGVLLGDYEIGLNDPPGTYIFTFEGESGTIQERIEVHAPDGPRLYVHELQRGILQLKHFSPHEKIRLFAYGERTMEQNSLNSEKLLGWQEFTVGSDGSLDVYVNDSTLRYIALGDVSGEVWPFGPDGGTRINGMHDGILLSDSDNVDQSTEVAPEAVAQVSSPTPKPTSTPRPAAPVPTSTPKPVNSLPTSAPEPASCSTPVDATFKKIWQQNGGVTVGCPAAPATTRAAAYQRFQNGVMVWYEGKSGGGGVVYVIYNTGNWQRYDDTFVEGQMEMAGYDAPEGLQEPVRGFGKVWRDQLGGTSAGIGWALAREKGDQVTVQLLDGGGVMVACDLGTYFLAPGRKSNVAPVAPPVVETQQPATCSVAVNGSFEGLWQRGGGASVSCPTGSVVTSNGAYQRFEHGWMVWFDAGSGGMIYVIYDGGGWARYRDTFTEGEMEQAGYEPPSGLLEPRRGFGKVWRDQLGGTAASIGWARYSEQGAQVTMQPFTGTGAILSFSEGTYYLVEGRNWVK